MISHHPNLPVHHPNLTGNGNVPKNYQCPARSSGNLTVFLVHGNWRETRVLVNPSQVDFI